MRQFNYGFLASIRLPAGLASLASQLAAARERQSGRGSVASETLSDLRRSAMIESVGSSNAIEGIVTSADRLHQIVQQESPAITSDEAQIAGYRDALRWIHTEHDRLSVSEATIRRLHELILGHSLLPAGDYKQTDNAILEIDSSGRRRVRFTPTPAADTPKAMEQFTLAYLDACGNQAVDPVWLLPCVIVDFLCIHPFSDGNGRVSRLMTVLLAYHAGFDVGQYVSVEAEINRTRDDYYDALATSSDGWHDNTNDYIPFIQYTLRSLLACYRTLDQRFAALGPGRVTKPDRVRAAVLASPVPITKAELAHQLPDIAVTTIEAALGMLVRQGIIAKIGRGRATAYRPG